MSASPFITRLKTSATFLTFPTWFPRPTPPNTTPPQRIVSSGLLSEVSTLANTDVQRREKKTRVRKSPSCPDGNVPPDDWESPPTPSYSERCRRRPLTTRKRAFMTPSDWNERDKKTALEEFPLRVTRVSSSSRRTPRCRRDEVFGESPQSPTDIIWTGGAHQSRPWWDRAHVFFT